MSLPPISAICTSQAALDDFLSTLLEPSRSLKEHLVPALSSTLSLFAGGEPETYSELIKLSEKEISTWSLEDKADFLGGHPRIGEVKGLSAFSSKEQSGSKVNPTPPEVLAKLEQLNALYERMYPGLKYVTFVAGRSRAQVAEDLESFLMQPEEMKDDDGTFTDPTRIHYPGSPEWRRELERGLADVFTIARARLRSVGLQ